MFITPSFKKSLIVEQFQGNYLNDWSRGEQWILFPKNLNVSRDELEGNIEIRGNNSEDAWVSRSVGLPPQ